MEQVIAFIGSGFALVASGLVSATIGFLVARSNFAKDIKKRNYVHLDNLYQNTLQLYLQHPEFQDAEKTRHFATAFKDNALLYDAFAAIIHNFLESIFDVAVQGDEIDPQWAQIFDHHAKLHLQWLLAKQRPFEREYYDFIKRKYKDLT